MIFFHNHQFILMLGIMFCITSIVSTLIILFFRKPLKTIFNRLINEDISAGWVKYITFAMFVVGVSGGVRVWELEKYLNPRGRNLEPIVLNLDRWVFEIYQSIIQTLQSISWFLLIVFCVALIVYAFIRGFEMKHNQLNKK